MIFFRLFDSCCWFVGFVAIFVRTRFVWIIVAELQFVAALSLYLVLLSLFLCWYVNPNLFLIQGWNFVVYLLILILIKWCFAKVLSSVAFLLVLDSFGSVKIWSRQNKLLMDLNDLGKSVFSFPFCETMMVVWTLCKYVCVERSWVADYKHHWSHMIQSISSFVIIGAAGLKIILQRHER